MSQCGISTPEAELLTLSLDPKSNYILLIYVLFNLILFI